MESMTGKERIMTALRNGQPDRIPVTPDISFMIPTKLAGKPSWEVEYLQNPSLQEAYIRAARYFQIDGWLFNGQVTFQQKSDVRLHHEIVSRDADQWKVRTIINTPDGDFTSLVAYPKDNPSVLVEKPVKNFKEDFKKIKHLYSEIVSCDASLYQQQLKDVGNLGMLCYGICPPGLQSYTYLMDVESLTYAYYDYPELFEELAVIHDRMCLQMTEMALEAGVESILTGGSGSITLQSPDIFRKLSFPTIKKITKLCKEAGVISGIHSCGKERAIVEMCANETDLNYINPLEIPPMGDCDLAECKKSFGDKIALMGNLHTTNTMLYGSVNDVKKESLKAILAAGAHGGFVLSTGDQCGRDTPLENIFEMVKTAREFGVYPLDTDRIKAEIKKIEKTDAE